VLTELKNRGIGEVCIAVCDGLKRLADGGSNHRQLATDQACIPHVIRISVR